MKPKHSKCDHLVNQCRSFADKLVLIGHIGKDHADAEPSPFDHKSHRQPDRDDILNPENQRIGRALPNANPRHTDIGIDRIG